MEVINWMLGESLNFCKPHVFLMSIFEQVFTCRSFNVVFVKCRSWKWHRPFHIKNQMPVYSIRNVQTLFINVRLCAGKPRIAFLSK